MGYEIIDIKTLPNYDKSKLKGIEVNYRKSLDGKLVVIEGDIVNKETKESVRELLTGKNWNKDLVLPNITKDEKI